MSAVIHEAMRPAPRRVARPPGTVGLSPALARYVAEVENILASCADSAAVPGRVAGPLSELARVHDLLTPQQRTGHPENYTRHTLYTDPRGRFTVLAIVWLPGQATPVHGHTAWGVVAVHEGHPTVALYEFEPGYGALPGAQVCCGPGEVSWVRAGIQYPHRIFNADQQVAITLHTYGRDLTDDPCGINIPV